MLGFRFDSGRDAYVLRLVGRRFGPVLRTEPHDSAAQAMDWPEELQRAGGPASAARAGRAGSREPARRGGPREHSLRD